MGYMTTEYEHQVQRKSNQENLLLLYNNLQANQGLREDAALLLEVYLTHPSSVCTKDESRAFSRAKFYYQARKS